MNFLTDEQGKHIQEEHKKEIEREQNHFKTCPLCWLRYWDELSKEKKESSLTLDR